MQPLRYLSARAAPLKMVNVDTDMIIPKQHLKTLERSGLGQFLFQELRFLDDGRKNPNFVLNQGSFTQAQVLVASENFGCGSSREHAVWALLDYGVRVVIAPSFGDIFHTNCFKNGVAPVRLPPETVEQIQDFLTTTDTPEITVDMESQEVRWGNHKATFDMDPFRRNCLIEGLDDIGLTLQKAASIDAFEKRAFSDRAFLYGRGG